MSQNYSKMNISLTSLDSYIKNSGVKLSKTQKNNLKSIFLAVSKGKGYIKKSIFSKFLGWIKNIAKGLYQVLLKFIKSFSTPKSNAKRNANALNNINKLMQKELNKRNIKLKPADKKYWANLINQTSNKYHVAPELLITIISKECGFEKHLTETFGAGPMGMTTAAIEAFTPKDSKGNKNDWYDIFNKMHPELLKDILKYSQSPKQLRQMAGKNDKLGILMGILTYEIKYCEVVAKKLYGKANYGTIPKAIDKVVNGGYRLNDAASIKNSLINYNGSSIKYTYGDKTMDTLSNTLSYNHYKDLIFRTPKQ